jgi:hypothetical protein
MFAYSGPLKVFDSLDSCLRGIFGGIYADEKFDVFANLSLLLKLE